MYMSEIISPDGSTLNNKLKQRILFISKLQWPHTPIPVEIAWTTFLFVSFFLPLQATLDDVPMPVALYRRAFRKAFPTPPKTFFHLLDGTVAIIFSAQSLLRSRFGSLMERQRISSRWLQPTATSFGWSCYTWNTYAQYLLVSTASHSDWQLLGSYSAYVRLIRGKNRLKETIIYVHLFVCMLKLGLIFC